MLSQTLRYAYFPGCVAQGACRELSLSTKALTKALGIELVELKKAACCGSGTFKEDSQLLEDTVNARNIALAEELNLPLLTHCSTCQGVIGHVDERLKESQQTNPNYVEQVNGLLKKEGCSPYRGSTEVKHLLWALVADYGLEELQSRVSRTRPNSYTLRRPIGTRIYGECVPDAGGDTSLLPRTHPMLRLASF